MEKQSEIAFRLVVNENGLSITGSHMIEYSMLNFADHSTFIVALPKINTNDLLFGKYPSFYNDGTIGVEAYMDNTFENAQIDTDFTFSTWVKPQQKSIYLKYDLKNTAKLQTAEDGYPIIRWWSPLFQDGDYEAENANSTLDERISFYLISGDQDTPVINMLNDMNACGGFNYKNYDKIKNSITATDNRGKSTILHTPSVMGRHNKTAFGFCTNLLTPGVIPITNGSNWIHIALTRKDNTLYLFYNGILQNTYTAPWVSKLIIAKNRLDIMASEFEKTVFSSIRCSYNDISLLLGKALWTSNFTPPSDLLFNNHIAVEEGIRLASANTEIGGSVWGFTKISDSMPKSSDEKIKLYEKTNYRTPTMENYSKVNNVFKINKYK